MKRDEGLNVIAKSGPIVSAIVIVSEIPLLVAVTVAL